MSADRITPRDVIAALANHIDALERYGVAYDGRLIIQQGSATYGRAWRVFRESCGGGGLCGPPIGSDYLGATAREAHAALTERTRAVHDMAYALALPRHETTRDRVETSLRRDAS